MLIGWLIGESTGILMPNSYDHCIEVGSFEPGKGLASIEVGLASIEVGLASIEVGLASFEVGLASFEVGLSTRPCIKLPSPGKCVAEL